MAGAVFGDVGVRPVALVMLRCHFSWQAQHLVMLERHFSWQAQQLVKFGGKPPPKTEPATTKTSPPRGTAKGPRAQKPRFGHQTATGKFFLWLIVLFPFETCAPGLPGSTCIKVEAIKPIPDPSVVKFDA